MFKKIKVCCQQLLLLLMLLLLLLLLIVCLFVCCSVVGRINRFLTVNILQMVLGGNVRLITTGAAPISNKVMTFLRCVLGSCYVSTL